METIFALATAPGKAGVAVIRISGILAKSAAETLANCELEPRGMSLRTLRDADRDILDQALVLTFQGPNSFTGEDVAELQVHGSNAVVSAILRCLADIDGLRIAEPGEFTRRSLLNGKMDLPQVEGIADLIESETEAQRRQAVRTMSGVLSDKAESWRKKLIRAGALIAATIDFADEDVPVDVTPEVKDLLSDVHLELKKMVSGVRIAERIRDGFEVAIVGPPNVGKSTLLNALAGRDAAITSEFEGTTRDIIEVRMDLGGLAVTLIDTAGIRKTTDVVENIGIARAKERAEAADIRLFLTENGMVSEFEIQPDDLVLISKADLKCNVKGAVSGITGEGIDNLIADLTRTLLNKSSIAGLANRERHRQVMNIAVAGLEKSLELLENGPELYDLVAEEIRISVHALGMLIGHVDVEDLLDEIFSTFCLGK